MHNLLRERYRVLQERLITNTKKHRSLLIFLTIFFLLSIGYIYGFERLFLGFAIIVALIFWGGLIFAIAHDFDLGWKATALIVIVWLMFIFSAAENNNYSDEECSRSYDLRGSYCE